MYRETLPVSESDLTLV